MGTFAVDVVRKESPSNCSHNWRCRNNWVCVWPAKREKREWEDVALDNNKC